MTSQRDATRKPERNRHGEPRCPVCPHFLNYDGAEGWICDKRGGCGSEFTAEEFDPCQGKHAYRPHGNPRTKELTSQCVVCGERETP